MMVTGSADWSFRLTVVDPLQSFSAYHVAGNEPHEQFPVRAFKAMACGVVVVVADIRTTLLTVS